MAVKYVGLDNLFKKVPQYQSSSKGMINIPDMHDEHLRNAFVKLYTKVVAERMRHCNNLSDMITTALDFRVLNSGNATLIALAEELGKRRSYQ